MAGVVAVAARVLVVGDANPDLILRGDVAPRFGQAEQLLDDATLVIGGSAAITAHAFARLGRPVSLVAAVGKDVFGTRICDDLAAAGVTIDSVVERVDEPTGITVVLSRADDRAILTMPGAIPTLTGTEVHAAIRSALRIGLRHLHVSSLFLHPALTRDLPDLLAEVRAGGVTTSLDTNDDPAQLWHGVDALLPHVDVLLPNRAEALALSGIVDLARAAAHLAARGPLVVVKDGADGAIAVGPSGDSISASTPARAAVDTTGAGDTFDAAFLDSWLTGLPLRECLHRAVAAGALAVTMLGGTAGQPTSQDLNTVGRNT